MSTLTSLGTLARSFVRRILRFYYPRIEIEGRERMPASGAVLFVANHPNSLLDPALIGFAAQRPVHFFAKAPLFDVPVFGALMRALGMVPAYRGQDDKAQVRKNLETLDVGAAYLKQGAAVGIFPEGKSHDREGVEQVRTGAARIVSQAVKGGATVTVVPLGLNYERKERFRSAIWVRVGEPIDANAWFRPQDERGSDGDRPQQPVISQAAGNAPGESDEPARLEKSAPEGQRKAMRALTEEIDRRLKHAVVHLHEERWQSFLPDLEILLPPEGDEARDPIAALRQRKRFADAMNRFLATDRLRAEAMAAAIEQHRNQLVSAGLTMDSPMLRQGVAQVTLHLVKETLWLLVGFVPAIAGALHHLVPFAVTRVIVRFVKYPGRTTIAQNRLMIGLPIYGLWYAFVWWLLATQTRAWIAWLWTGLMPLAGIAALHYSWRLRHAGRAWWHELKMLARPKQLRRLRIEQAALRRQLQRLREEYRSRLGVSQDEDDESR